MANIRNYHADAGKFPVFPMLFITISCGAISGFHATQSPLMARCITKEKYGRRVFYGAMISEGVVALIWAAIGMSFYGGVKELNEVMITNQGNAAFIVNEISNSLLGKFGRALALLGVVAAPITSDDTAFPGNFLFNRDSDINRITCCFSKISKKYNKMNYVFDEIIKNQETRENYINKAIEMLEGKKKEPR